MFDTIVLLTGKPERSIAQLQETKAVFKRG